MWTLKEALGKVVKEFFKNIDEYDLLINDKYVDEEDLNKKLKDVFEKYFGISAESLIKNNPNLNVWVSRNPWRHEEHLKIF
ncbi:hypothetical protein TMA_112 [Thermus phage TMA]|uniref:hypothetical protein n=1 Tax=Thermus phage TMA TaxID=699370 RepID=UPI00021AADE0|nr:hypothetical protein TMA_112 [Thermus phage TMA]BAK53800.1 hypothetical protein TMA_112 [Thermus phage TMA]